MDPIPILQHFRYEHLPKHLQKVSKKLHDLAHEMANSLSGPEVEAGLRKLLEAKDCFVRAAVPPHRVLVCGVDCHPGDDKCNGYCRGDVDKPPPGPDA